MCVCVRAHACAGVGMCVCVCVCVREREKRQCEHVFSCFDAFSVFLYNLRTENRKCYNNFMTPVQGILKVNPVKSNLCELSLKTFPYGEINQMH